MGATSYSTARPSRIFLCLCAPGASPNKAAIRWTAAGGWVLTPKPRGRSGRCSSSSCASRRTKVWTLAKSRLIAPRCSAACWLRFSDHLTKRLDAGSQRCELVHGRRGTLARESVVKAPLFVVAEVREVESGGGRERNLNVVLNLATAIKEEWLREMFPRASRKRGRSSTTRRCGVWLRGRRDDFAICFWKKRLPTIHRRTKPP